MATTRDTIALREYNTEFVLTDAAGNPKLLWQENAFGRWIRSTLGREFRIPGLTGCSTYRLQAHNLVTNVGHTAANARISGQGSYAAFTTIAIGSGTTAAAAGDTTLGTEITTGGGARGAATASQTTTTTSNDTMQLVKTFTFTASFAVTEEGILDNASSGGNLFARQVFAALNVASGDSLQITHRIST